MPPSTVEILERESRDFLADVELFLEAECEPTTSETVGCEVSFGRPLNGDDEVLARAEPVEIDLGGGHVFRFAGRIDRIDKVGPASFEIVDYKTGGFWRDKLEGNVRWRASAAARALWACRRGAAARALQEPEGHRRPSTTSRTRAGRSACASLRQRRTRSLRCWATCASRSSSGHSCTRPETRRLQVLRLRRRVRRRAQAQAEGKLAGLQG